jgi:hypothetical protein
MKRATGLLAVLVLLLGPSVYAEQPEERTRVSVQYLPTLIMAYYYFLSEYPNFLEMIKSPGERDKHQLLTKLHAAIEGLQPRTELPGRLAFSRRTFLVQTDMKGQLYGYSWAKDPDKGNLFVTLPPSDAEQEVVVISSGVAPQQTTIFTLDTTLHALLIYDTDVMNTLRDERVASIYQVRVRSPEALELRERKWTPTQGVGGGRRLLLARGKDGYWRLSVMTGATK